MAKSQEVKELLNAGVHFGHLTRRWDPNMEPYVYMERNGIHIINLYKTVAKMEEAGKALHKIAASGRQILFVATKKQAKEIVAQGAEDAQMPYITERWPGGMLTNFVTIRRAVKKMKSVDQMKKDGRFEKLSKKERLQIERMRAKLDKQLGSISEMTRLPGAIFIVDTTREHIAVKEAQRLNIPIFAMVDTNSDPRQVDYAIPSNDDASKSIKKIIDYASSSISEGLDEREADKKVKQEQEAKAKKEKEQKAKAKKDAADKKKAEEKAAKKEQKASDDKKTEEKAQEKQGKEDADKKVKAEEKTAKSDDKKPAKSEPKSVEKKEVPSKDEDDKKQMKEAEKENKLESKEETLEKATEDKKDESKDKK